MAKKSKRSKNIDRWIKRHEGKHLCACGCGWAIEIKREHAKKSVGIPQFIKGHNLGLEPEVLKAIEEPKESAWDKLSEEEKQRRLSLLVNFKSGEDNPSWKGGRLVDEHGYIKIRLPEHPFAKDGYVFEHRLAVEERTRKYFPDHPCLVKIDGVKYLKPSAVVHHVDETKDNNYSGKGPDDFGNLMLLPNQNAHAFIHKSPLPLEERIRRINLGIYHSGPLEEGD
jgi:hypothetical protein